MDICRNYFSTMEHGKVEIGAEILLRISREFAKSVEWLLREKSSVSRILLIATLLANHQVGHRRRSHESAHRTAKRADWTHRRPGTEASALEFLILVVLFLAFARAYPKLKAEGMAA